MVSVGVGGRASTGRVRGQASADKPREKKRDGAFTATTAITSSHAPRSSPPWWDVRPRVETQVCLVQGVQCGNGQGPPFLSCVRLLRRRPSTVVKTVAESWSVASAQPKIKEKEMTDADAPPAGAPPSPLGPAGDDAVTTTAPAAPPPSADALLALDPAAASDRWAALDDAALDAEVAAYRAALEDMRTELASLGRSVELEDGQAGTIAGIEVRAPWRGRRGGELARNASALSKTGPRSRHPATLITHSHIINNNNKTTTGRRGRGLPPGLCRRPGPIRVAGVCVGWCVRARRPPAPHFLQLALLDPTTTVLWNKTFTHTHKTHTHTHTQVQPHCIPVHANVTTYDWSRLTTACPGGFDVIMMDPPWQLATANPTRGVALGYSQLTDADITALPIPALQANGFLFIWVINAKYKFALDLFANWGYELGCFFFFFFSFAGGALVALYCMRAWCEPGPPAPSIVSFSLTPACRISSSYSSKTFQAGRRDRVGEDHGQPAPGQVARLLPAARQGSLPGRAEGCGPARRSHVRGRRRHLRRAPGPIPETGGDLPAGRGARAQW